MERALIVGLGLVGGSAGIALRHRGWRVRYCDPNVALGDALRAEAADAAVTAFPSAIDEDEVVLLATPLDVALAMIPAIEPLAMVTTTCSVMRPLRDVAGRDRRFVAGHPMAGSHERGLAAARSDLFAGKNWFLDAEDDRVDRLVTDCGARIERVDAADHDAAVALTSHLPQILSTALAAYLEGRPDLARFAGSGLRTFLRLAASDADLWTPILAANRDNLAPHAEALAQLVREILEGDREAFGRAQRFWRNTER